MNDEQITFAEVKKAALKPGDVLVLTIDRPWPTAMLEHVKTDLGLLFPDNKVLVVTHDAELEIVSPESRGGQKS